MDVLDLISDDLTIIEITHGSNGYPQGMGDHGIIDFETFEQAKELADKHGLEVGLFTKRQGHQLWTYMGQRHEPLSANDYLADLGDDYSEADVNDDFIRETLSDLTKKITDGDFTEIRGFIDRVEKIQDEVQCAEKDEMVIVCQGEYYETIDRKLMGYCEDVHTYTIGVFVPKS